MKQQKVIIIGAGMAGVKTALDLYKAGVLDTIILEARDRVGGRLVSHKSTKNAKLKYDFGASWFHDALKNPLFEKAQKLGNIDYYFDDRKHVYVGKDSREIPLWKFESIVEEIGDYANLIFEENPSKKDISLREICDEYLAKYDKHLNDDEKRYAKQVVRLWSELWDGISWEDMSAKQSSYQSGHYGRNAFVTNGFVNVFNNELNELPKWYLEHNIKLNTHVRSIDYSNPKMVTVTTAAGEVYTADYLVSTIPPSLLSLNDPVDKCYVSWNPPLPQRFVDIWPDCSFGSLGKVVFEFDQSFWPKDIERFYVLADEVDSSGSVRPWQYPTLIVNYYALTGTPSLVCLTQEPVSRQIEKMSKEDIWKLFEPVITQIAKGPVRKPFQIYNTPWNGDEYTRGSYSASRCGSVDNSVICDTLAGGVNDRVRFAGAETIDGASNGCAHGAWFSGEREARHILRHSKALSKL